MTERALKGERASASGDTRGAMAVGNADREDRANISRTG